MTSTRVTDAQLKEWRATNFPYKLIAAKIAEWAATQEYGTVLPDDATWGIEAAPRTFHRAKQFLVSQDVLEIGDGPFYAA